MRKLSSQHLYHFTSELKTLASILSRGFEHRPIKEDLPLTGYSESPFSVPDLVRYEFEWPVVCFCDIPEHTIRDHSNQYGKYGLCLKKKWGISKGVTPIRYVHHHTPDIKDDTFYLIQSCLDIMGQSGEGFSRIVARSLSEDVSEEEWKAIPNKIQRIINEVDNVIPKLLEYSFTYLGLMRRYEGNWTDRVTKNVGQRVFYDEKEWRSLKTSTQQTNLLFSALDVIAVILPTQDHHQLETLMEMDNTMITYDEICSKITSMDTWCRDHKAP